MIYLFGCPFQFPGFDPKADQCKEDARGKIWTYEYDAIGHLTLIIDPLGHETHIYYDKKGNKVREVDAENKEKTYEYDLNDNLVKTTDGAGKPMKKMCLLVKARNI